MGEGTRSCGVLLLHGTAPIEKFTLAIYDEYAELDVDLVRGWLTHVLNRSVQKLSVASWKVRDNDSLQRLVSGCIVLEELFIERYWSPYEPCELCISSPSLKKLKIGDCSQDLEHIAVNAPNLVYFNLSDARDYVLRYSLVNLQSLVTVDFQDMYFNEYFWGAGEYVIDEDGNVFHSRDIAHGLLTGISNVHSLYLSSDLSRIFTLFDEPLLEYQNLVLLEIRCGYEYNGGLPQLLEMTPNLRTLIFREFDKKKKKKKRGLPEIITPGKPSAYEVLQDFNFPIGILPKGVLGYELDSSTGKFSAFFNGSCSFSLEGSYQLKYKNTIQGFISNGKLARLEGVSVKLWFMWVDIVEVSRRGDDLEFSVGIAGADFPIDNFEECPQCGCGLNCNDQKVRKIRKNPFISSY
ncbi:hypothetical protein COLO4_10538 [Corchorus olitorius]|uniref:F-box/LRR-repeat protein 15/At3g58940/PEG3-like LRR domain-containing protein n=1 Tax=Corchorus olitorius TaxID=93759 RepID=A0A1R3K879_9ROSI|nr:hypothetical protein COLO4_10538 [Corchorus olitorius]